MSKKQLIIIIDGLFDSLKQDKTPLMLAKTPFLDVLTKASSGVFCLRTIGEGLSINSYNAHKKLFNIADTIETNRLTAELLGIGVELNSEYLMWRLNIDDWGLADERPIAQQKIRSQLKASAEELGFKVYQLHNSAFILAQKANDLEIFKAKQRTVEKKLEQAVSVKLRLWQASAWQSLEKQNDTGKKVLVAATPVVKGLAVLSGMVVYDQTSFTADYDTDLRGKINKSLQLLDDYQQVFCHIEATDLLSHARKRKKKKEFIERLDREFLALLYTYIMDKKPELELFILPDHATSSISGKHFARKVKVLYLNSPLLEHNSLETYSESSPTMGKIVINADGYTVTIDD